MLYETTDSLHDILGDIKGMMYEIWVHILLR